MLFGKHREDLRPYSGSAFADFGGRVSGALIVLGAAVIAVAAGVVWFFYAHQEKLKLTQTVSLLTKEKGRYSSALDAAQKSLRRKEEDLALARKENFQQDLLFAQEAFKEARQKISAMVNEKSGLENTNLILNSRLENTTGELARTLEELKKAREVLNGIEGQHKLKLNDLLQSVKLKEEQILKFQERLKDKEGLIDVLEKRQSEYAQALKRYQEKQIELENTVSVLNKSVAQKEDEAGRYKNKLGLAEGELEKIKKARKSTQDNAFSALEKEKLELEKQVSESSVRLFDQEEELQGMRKKVGALEEGARRLQREKNELEDSYAQARARQDEYDTGGLDRQLRLLTDRLAQKEERIQQLELDQKSAKPQKTAELEALVKSLMKQLGEYAMMMEKNDAELKSGVERIASLAQELDAQRAAAGALEKELADARRYQEKTYESLRRIMDLNPAGPAVSSTAPSPPRSIPQGWEASLSANEQMDASGARKRVEDLKRQVEVLLESKG